MESTILFWAFFIRRRFTKKEKRYPQLDIFRLIRPFSRVTDQLFVTVCIELCVSLLFFFFANIHLINYVLFEMCHLAPSPSSLKEIAPFWLKFYLGCFLYFFWRGQPTGIIRWLKKLTTPIAGIISCICSSVNVSTLSPSRGSLADGPTIWGCPILLLL